MIDAHLRVLQLQDLNELVAIEQAAHLVPWSPPLLHSCLDSSQHHCCGIAAAHDEALLGFTISQQVLDEVELHNICVHPSAQGRGLGGVLLEALFDYHFGLNAALIHLEVRVSNQAAIALYQRQGFVECGERRDYYRMPDGTKQDALLFRKDLVWPDK